MVDSALPKFTKVTIPSNNFLEIMNKECVYYLLYKNKQLKTVKCTYGSIHLKKLLVPNNNFFAVKKSKVGLIQNLDGLKIYVLLSKNYLDKKFPSISNFRGM